MGNAAHQSTQRRIPKNNSNIQTATYTKTIQAVSVLSLSAAAHPTKTPGIGTRKENSHSPMEIEKMSWVNIKE
jgi:hypothetical protein